MKLRLLPMLCLLLTACGQAGPLYLPGQEPPKHGHSLRPDTHKPADELPPQRTSNPNDAHAPATGTTPTTPGSDTPDGTESVPTNSAGQQTQQLTAPLISPSLSAPPPPTPPTSP